MRFGQRRGASRKIERLNLRRANRHGLIAGATGTGKTVTLQTLAENFSLNGIPVFCADVKGDLSGIAITDGTTNDYAVFWDLFGREGHPVRTTVDAMGPLLMSRMMELTRVQEGVLAVAFKYASDKSIKLSTLKDFRGLLVHLADNSRDISVKYGNVTPGSIGAIQRQLTMFENEGGEEFFGSPPLDVHDFFRITPSGRGQINILAAQSLMQSPKVYSTFLLWLLSEMFRVLPEVGDPDKPKMVFIFDEAHLLFNDASKALIDTIERVVRLIRSKGVGVYFVTQAPSDVPERILAQLGNRVQHALRAFTPRAERFARAAAQTFRPNAEFDTFAALTSLRVGQAIVSTLDEHGAPTTAQRVKIDFPKSRVGPIDPDELQDRIKASPFHEKYQLEKSTSPVNVSNQETIPLWRSALVVAIQIGIASPFLLLAYAIYSLISSIT